MTAANAPRVLLIGGSGFVSGTLAREAITQGMRVWAVTRGNRELPKGVRGVKADRKDAAALGAAVASAAHDAGGAFDLVVDCIGFHPAEVAPLIGAIRGRATHFVFISTDFTYDPATRRFPQPEEGVAFVQEENYGGNKRRSEIEIATLAGPDLAWTVFRPCHIYGPGSQLGCSPPDNRDAKLIEKIRGGQTIPLVGPRMLQQPIFAPDLAKLILSVRGKPAARSATFNAAGPDVVESLAYYQCIADALGAPLKFEDVPLEAYRASHPDKAPFLCHRFYDLTRLRAAGLATPATPLRDGIKAHVASLL